MVYTENTDLASRSGTNGLAIIYSKTDTQKYIVEYSVLQFNFLNKVSKLSNLLASPHNYTDFF